ncbi:putative ABC transporter ATP-binding protein YlmA [Anaerohalosphaera lusitana]|uniref:Putative ABC transporter ATP-binding protein YlmA n=1 Tax=Anaerohalosphaera lusitana TaxID=1936003 RepID=A0A1U9NP83_9BACT|nr:ABC transporter ATP-binding protein [Anaerohalosphaera lusitana]AQT69752.1 putative ABC transporter ATP-binding protein YlmA [Anaerohalosphaera lusitana]
MQAPDKAKDCLTLKDISVTAGPKPILQIDSLHLHEREFTGVIGANGAGKSTLLKLCCGLVLPHQGSVKLCGREIASTPAWKRPRALKHIGYVPQSTEYNPDLPFTALEVVLMGITGTKPLTAPLTKNDREIARRWLDELGLDEYRNRTFRSLSGGEQQKTMIAAAMASDPKLLLLDEPGASLDFGWKEQLVAILEKLNDISHAATIFVSHEANLLPACCKRLVLLRSGRIAADGSTIDVLNSDHFRAVYGRNIKVTNLAGRWHAAANI